MTRTRTRTYGVLNPSTRQPLLEAMLRAYLWLVSNVVSTIQTIFNRRNRDWHTDDAHEDQLPTLNDPTQKEAHTFEPSFSGKRSARIPRIPVASTRGTRLATLALALSPLIPTKVGIQGRTRSLSRPAASNLRTQHTHSRIPTPHPEPVEGRRNERFMLRKIGLT